LRFKVGVDGVFGLMGSQGSAQDWQLLVGLEPAEALARAAVAELLKPQAEYAAWLGAMPEALKASATAEALAVHPRLAGGCGTAPPDQPGTQQGRNTQQPARAVLIHRLGEIRDDRTYGNQQHRASGLNLLVTAINLGNMQYLERPVAALRQTQDVPDQLLAYLSPSAGST
jgi:hypothetical protein